MARQHTLKRQRQRTMNAVPRLGVILIQIRRSNLRPEAKSGKKVPAKQQPMFSRVVPAVSMRMPGQCHHAKTTPNRYFITILE